MSTKLYAGYRLTPGTNPLTFQREVRAALNPVRDYLDARLLVRRAVELADDRLITAKPFDPKASLIAEATLSLFHELSEHTPTSTFHDPHRFSFTIGPDPHTQQLYVVLFYIEPEYKKAWEALPGVEPFPYWNNTDRPEDVSRLQWEERREIWDRVLGFSGNTKPDRLAFTLRPETEGAPLMTAREIGEHFQDGATEFDRETRAARLAHHLVVNQALKLAVEQCSEFQFSEAVKIINISNASKNDPVIRELTTQIRNGLPELSLQALHETNPDWLPSPEDATDWEERAGRAARYIYSQL